MTKDIDDGGAAFACPSVLDQRDENYEMGSIGLSQRDYFAAQALPSLILAHEQGGNGSYSLHMELQEGGAEIADNLADVAYHLADAMIRRRDKRG